MPHMHPKMGRVFSAMLAFAVLASFASFAAADSIGDTLGGNKFKKTLYTSDEIKSQNGKYRLVMQSDCNLVLYGPKNAAIWSSNTQGAGKLCILYLAGGDSTAYGNALQIKDYSRKTIWEYSDNSVGDCYLQVDNWGGLLFPCVKTLSSKTITNPGGKVLGYDTIGGPACKGKLVMFTGDSLTSRNGAYRLVMGIDCNLVLKHQPTGTVLWSSETAGQGTLCSVYPYGPIDFSNPRYSCFGHLIEIKDHKYHTVWSIRGNGYCGLTVKNNGHLVFSCKAYVHGVGDPRNEKLNAAL